MVIKPVISHAVINQPALPTYLVISLLTMNIPEPIIPPATIIVASKAPSLGLNSVVSAVLVVDMIVWLLVI